MSSGPARSTRGPLSPGCALPVVGSVTPADPLSRWISRAVGPTSATFSPDPPEVGCGTRGARRSLLAPRSSITMPARAVGHGETEVDLARDGGSSALQRRASPRAALHLGRLGVLVTEALDEALDRRISSCCFCYGAALVPRWLPLHQEAGVVAGEPLSCRM